MSSRLNFSNDSSSKMNNESRKGDIWRTNNNSHFENISLEASPRLDYLRDYDECDTATTEALSVSPSTSKPSVEGGFHRETFKSFSSDEFDYSSINYRDPQSSSSFNGHNIFLPVLEGTTCISRHGEAQIHLRDETQNYRPQQKTKQGPIGKYASNSLFLKDDTPLSPPRAKAMDDTRDNTSPMSSPTLSPATLSPAHGLNTRSPGVDMKRPVVKHPSQIVIKPSLGMSSYSQAQQQQQQRALSLQLSKNRQFSHPIQPRQLPDIQQSAKTSVSHTSSWGNRAPAYAISQGSQPSSQGRHLQSPPPSNTGTASSSVRSPQEVLKTLLRKKACLYEPGTSQAIALITWIVGRGLALQQGYFTRQHLQSGVHMAVADKIDSGFITRTKVNRCMQCILNSCFHYIIPRPDGSEEKGDLFQALFRKTVVDDTHLIRSLPPPWGDVKLDWDHLFESIRLDEASYKDDIESEHLDHDGSVDANRRPVLLCFNDNVRSADDVLRCHNEFIRDAALSANLLLSAEEWRSFFSRVDDDTSLTEALSESSVTGLSPRSPMMKGTEKKEENHFSIDLTSFYEYQWPSHGHCNTSERWMKKPDYFGSMCLNDLARFRTEWCCKRYDHNHAVCRFAHSSVNEGWLRRDPTKFHYCAKMCPHVTHIENEALLLSCHVNVCKDGVRCRYAHSQEEISFHPDHYKTLPCESFRKNILSCESRDICPHFHPCDHYSSRYSRRQMDWSPRFKSSSSTVATTKHHSLSKTCIIPEAASTLYVSPAPESEFEKTLIFPGIKSLFRRHGSTIIANHYGYTQKDCNYSLFGDDWGLPTKAFPINVADSALCGFSLYSD